MDCLCLIIAKQLTFCQYANSTVYYTGSVKQPLETVLSSAQGLGKKRLWTGLGKWPKIPHKLRGVHYPTCHIWLSRELNVEGCAVGEAESCISGHRNMHSWKWCGLHACSPPQCALSPILISRGASWRGGRTAVQLAARRLFISSASPLSACLPACLPSYVHHK